MANGYLCKHCGHQESEHTYDTNPQKGVDGFRVSLELCRGFSLSREDQKEQDASIKPVDYEWHDRRAEEKSAWGQFVVVANTINMKKKLSRFNYKIKGSYGTEREKAEAEKKDYLDECRDKNHQIFIGG